jgi:DNA-binding NtrC family response regulator
VLETNRICRVGSTREIPVDVRVVCATHRDLEAMCEAGTFRRDLFYRINAVPVRIPPLRERRDEIRLLAEHFAHLASETNQREVKGIAPRALELLERYHWPGNIRELRNVIERAVVIARRPEISEDDLPERVRPDVLGQGDVSPPARPRRVTQSVPVPPILVDATAPSVLLGDRRKSTSDEEPGNRSLEARVQAFEISLIRRALHHTQGNQTKAAALLRIPRRTLIYKIGAYHIDETAPLPTGHADHQHLAATADGPIDFKERVQWFKADLVREALARCGGVAAEAGRLLGVTERVIWLEIQKHGLRGTYR